MDKLATQSFSEAPYALMAVAAAILLAALGWGTGYWIAYVAAAVVLSCLFGFLGTVTIGPHHVARRSPFSDRKILWREISDVEIGDGCTWFLLNGSDGKRLSFAAPKLFFWEADSDRPAAWLEEMALERGIPVSVNPGATPWMKHSRGT